MRSLSQGTIHQAVQKTGGADMRTLFRAMFAAVGGMSSSSESSKEAKSSSSSSSSGSSGGSDSNHSSEFDGERSWRSSRSGRFPGQRSLTLHADSATDVPNGI